MPFDIALLLLSIFFGAALQVGVGIGFSIVVAPVMMVLLGTATAVPVLLMLNTLVSLVALDLRLWRQESRLIRNAILGCLAGITLGLLIYPLLSEPAVLSVTAALLLFGVIVSTLPRSGHVGQRGFQSMSALSGLATVWAATHGPLMVLGLLVIGRSPGDWCNRWR